MIKAIKNNKHKAAVCSIILVIFTLTCGLFYSTNQNAYAQYTADVVPTMTGYTTPSGIASASSEYGSGYEAWRTFDDIDNGYGWNTTPQYVTTGWLAYEFPIVNKICKYTLKSRNGAAVFLPEAPKDWTFEGWNGSSWVVLDTRSNITGWAEGAAKEFTFPNSTAYIKYRINVTANNGGSYLSIGEMEMMESTVMVPNNPTNLAASSGNGQVTLTWDTVSGATGYNVKRATTTGGPYTTVTNNVYALTYADTTVTNGVTYYYVVTALNASGESGNSNEVSATPQATSTGNNALLIITMVEGTVKEFDLTKAQVDAFTAWYNSRASGTGSPYYTINKNFNTGPFISRKDNIVFDKIVSFEINEY